MNYKGKTVWITGASSGIGAELARQFAAEGAKVIISSHEAEELEGVRKQLEPVSKDVHTVVFNLGNPDEVQAAAEKVLKDFGRVDVLMNNGGISTRALAADPHQGCASEDDRERLRSHRGHQHHLRKIRVSHEKRICCRQACAVWFP